MQYFVVGLAVAWAHGALSGCARRLKLADGRPGRVAERQALALFLSAWGTVFLVSCADVRWRPLSHYLCGPLEV